MRIRPAARPPRRGRTPTGTPSSANIKHAAGNAMLFVEFHSRVAPVLSARMRAAPQTDCSAFEKAALFGPGPAPGADEISMGMSLSPNVVTL